MKHIKNTGESSIPGLNEHCSSIVHRDILNRFTVVFLLWITDSGAVLHKRVNDGKVSSLLKLLLTALEVAMHKQKLGVSFVCHGCDMF